MTPEQIRAIAKELYAEIDRLEQSGSPTLGAPTCADACEQAIEAALREVTTATRAQCAQEVEKLRVVERERLEDAYKLPHTSGQLRRQNVSNGYLKALDDVAAALRQEAKG